jgi:mycothiol synthase
MPAVTSDLPPGHAWRRPTVGDAEAIHALVAACNNAILGYADVTLNDIRDELDEPDFDPESDGWLVTDGSGVPVGYGWACRKGDSDGIGADAIALDGVVAEWLWAAVIDRAAGLAAELGHDEVNVDIGIYRADEAQRERAAAHGFAPGTTYHRMRIDHEGTPTDPAVPDGVEVRIGPGDETFRRHALEVMNEANVGQFGYVARTFDEWHALTESSASHDWSQLRVAYIDGTPVGMLQGNNQFVTDEGCGYVQRVAVLPPARGRGIARVLLRQAFAADARRGRNGTLLHVDTNNPTPALNLYLSVGMRPVLVIDMWRRTLTTR